METVDGQVFNPSPTCMQKGCPHKSAARLVEINTKRKKRMDLCTMHALNMKRVYKNDLDVVAAWGGLTVEEFDD